MFKSVNRRFLLSIILVLASVGLFGCNQSAPEEEDAAPAEKGTINIGEAPYENIKVPVHIIKHIAEELGYDTNITQGDVGIMFSTLANGEIDVYPDVWLPTVHSNYMERYSEDQIELLSTMYEDAATGWAVPTYVDDINSIEDLKGNAEKFDGKVVGIEPGAGMMNTSEEVIAEYGLDGYEILSSSTQAMLAEVKRASANQEPIVFLAWRPHTMFKKFDIKLLEDPQGVWSADDVRIGVNPGLQEKAPDLYSFLQNFKISIDEIEDIMVKMEDQPIEDLTREWIDNNREQMDEWLNTK